jgi:aldehyde dehydrogenase (NAD+)
MGLTEAELKFPTLEQIDLKIAKVRNAFASKKTRSLDFRRSQLNALITMLETHKSDFVTAQAADIGKSVNETLNADVYPVINEACHMIEHLEEYAKTDYVKNDLVNIMDTTCVTKVPLGHVLIIGAWNYMNLTLGPLIGAIAAGCTAIVKPSEISSHCAKLFEELLPKYLDSECYIVVNGAVKETEHLLKYQGWGHIFFTGSTAVGKLVMGAAAKHLTSVTLELGGKSPAIVSDDSDLNIVASRLGWGRLVNAGQTCIAIDYVLCSKNTQAKLLPLLEETLKKFYPDGAKQSKDYGRIVNLRNLKRLEGYLKESKGTIVIGGESDEKELYMSPTVVINPSDDEPLMTEEIFGPILPIKTVESIQEAVEYVGDINSTRHHPLALYFFSRNKREIDYVLENTISGGAVINDSIMHFAASGLYFGGVKKSGIGAYHGKKSFDTFTHLRGTLIKSQNLESVNWYFRYPPYIMKRVNLLTKILYKTKPSGFFLRFPWKKSFILLFLTAFAYLLAFRLRRM